MADTKRLGMDCTDVWAIEVARRPCPQKWPVEEGLQPPLVMFIAGYRRTGKTTFGDDLASGTFSHTWEAYAAAERRNMVSLHHEAFAAFRGAPRFAFADELRRTVRRVLQLGEHYDFEKGKDTDVVAGKLVRQHLLDLGKAGRTVDLSHWSKLALVPFYRHADASAPVIATAICTDWRFTAERMVAVRDGQVRSVTVRLYRSAVPVPAALAESEHDLDGATTDYLLVPDARQFASAVEMWPQYATYERVAVLGASGLTLVV